MNYNLCDSIEKNDSDANANYIGNIFASNNHLDLNSNRNIDYSGNKVS